MKIDFNKSFETLSRQVLKQKQADGTEKPVMMYEIVAEMIVGHTDKNSIKLFELAKTAYNDKCLNLDTSDQTLVKEAIEGSNYSALVKGQLLLELQKQKK